MFELLFITKIEAAFVRSTSEIDSHLILSILPRLCYEVCDRLIQLVSLWLNPVSTHPKEEHAVDYKSSTDKGFWRDSFCPLKAQCE